MELSRKIELTLLKSDVNYDEVDRFLNQTQINEYYGLCVPPYFVEYVRNKVEDEHFNISTVVGYPLGFGLYRGKVEEIKEVINDGANEIEAVINYGAVKTGNWKYVDNEIDSLSSMCRVKSAQLKLIIDRRLFNEDEIKRVIDLSVYHNVAYIKAGSDIFGDIKPEDIQFLKKFTGSKIKIQAFGNIRTWKEAKELISSGADRISTSHVLK